MAIRLVQIIPAAILVLTAGCVEREETSAQVTPVPRPGGVLRVALDLPEDLDPAETNDAYEASIVNQLFSGLVRWDDDLNILPDVAESWIISRDGLTYEFDLRRDARFHNGRPVAARDFVFSFTRLLDPNQVAPSIIQDYLHCIEGAPELAAGTTGVLSGVTALGPHRLRIRLREPYPSFLSVLCMDQAKVIPEEEVRRTGEDFSRRPVGSGAFRFASRDPRRIVLARNPDYYMEPAYLDSLQFIDYPSEETERAGADLQAGLLDAVELRSALWREAGEPASIDVLRRPELSLEMLALNVARPPLDRVEVRRALAMALDQAGLLAASGPAYDTPVGLLPPGMSGFTPESKVWPENLDEARALMEEAGYGPGNPLCFEVFTASRGGRASVRDSVLAAGFARVHATAVFRYVDWGEFDRRMNRREGNSFLLTWIADLPDPDSFLFTLFGSRGQYNFVGYADAEVDSLFDRGRNERDRAARLALYRLAERRILIDVPVIPLYNRSTLLAFRRGVRGIEMSPIGLSGVPMEKIWLEAPPPEGTYAGL